ncbi:TauD/TfdA family dioxygenase [Nitrosopumilus adriaticus]|uniref:TauD/TfdA family dioxygenase n=1 Tax=Nitrosopumilus adriaticus TaxID=1580092 RepID=UPI00352CB1B6
MSQILDKIVFDENLAWDNKLQNKIDKFSVTLSKDAISELLENRNNLQENSNNFTHLRHEIEEFRKILIDGCGFFIIQNSCFNDFSDNEKKTIFSIISEILGTLYIQNIKNEKFVIITDEGKSMKTGGRYHQTRDGGSYHTDSPQWLSTPDYIALLCVRPAKIGGTSKFLSAYSIHNKLYQNNKTLLEELYRNFHFDKRGEFKENESPTVFKPIFEYKQNRLTLRYLRDYIDKGHQIQNQPLSKIQNDSLDCFDKITKDESIAVDYDLQSGDMVFFNNHRVLHGRTSFEDYDDPKLKRYLIRTWIKDNNLTS